MDLLIGSLLAFRRTLSHEVGDWTGFFSWFGFSCLLAVAAVGITQKVTLDLVYHACVCSLTVHSLDRWQQVAVFQK